MRNYENAGLGVRKMYIASLGMVIVLAISIFPMNILSALLILAGVIVFGIMNMAGMYQAGKDIEGCHRAFVFLIASFFLSLIAKIYSGTAFGSLMSICENIISILTSYYVYTSIAAVMNQIGEFLVARVGNIIWKIDLGCYIIVIIVTMLSVFSGMIAYAFIGAVLAVIASLISWVLGMVFFYQSSKALQAQVFER